MKTKGTVLMFVERAVLGLQTFTSCSDSDLHLGKGPSEILKAPASALPTFLFFVSKLSVITNHLGEKTGIKLLLSPAVSWLYCISHSRFSAELSVVFAEGQRSVDPIWLFHSYGEITEVQLCHFSEGH